MLVHCRMPQEWCHDSQHNDTQHKRHLALGIIDTKHNNALPLCRVSCFIYYSERHYAECYYAVCRYAMFNVVKLSVIMVNVVKLSAIMINVVKLSAIMLNVVKLSVIMLSVVAHQEFQRLYAFTTNFNPKLIMPLLF